MILRPPISILTDTLFPNTTLFRSGRCFISPSKKYIPLGGLDGKGGNEHSFQQLMRMPLQQPAVFECPGFHFVSIADDVFLCDLLIHWYETPFYPCVETRPAPSFQIRVLHLGRHLSGSHFQSLPQRLVASQLFVFYEQIGREHV